MKLRKFRSTGLNSLVCVTILAASMTLSSASYGQPPPNDSCVNVTPLPCPIQDTGNNENATNDGLGVCDAEWWGPETWHAFTITDTSDVLIVVCGLENWWSDGWEYVTLITACNCDNIIPAHDWMEWPSACTAGFGGYAVNWTSLPAGTYYYPVLNSFAVNGSTAHGAYSISITCATCAPATQATVLRPSGSVDSVRVQWFADQNFGSYEVWRTANPNNDGNPDNGSDPDWIFVAAVPAPATNDFQSYSDAFTDETYYIYVVVHDCNP